jgi:predicted dehydrogenase
MNKENKLSSAVIGYGYWGPNLARNISTSEEFELKYICEPKPESKNLALVKYPHCHIISNYLDMLKDNEINAVFIATPPSTHFSIALDALRHGKHVLVEKPLACSSVECLKLIEEAEKHSCILMVDHTFTFTGAVRKMKELSTSSIGDLLYYDSVRINLGLFQRDVNVLWDLAVHDLSILDNVSNFTPVAVSATGHAHVEGYPCNTAYLTLFYDESFIAHIHCSWMAPVKIRKTLLGGSKKMIVYDDLEPTEKIKVYDKGISINPTPEEKYDLRVDYRSADVFSPKLDGNEALRLMLDEFYKSISVGRMPTTDPLSGMRIVSILESADISLSQKGEPVEISVTHG